MNDFDVYKARLVAEDHSYSHSPTCPLRPTLRAACDRIRDLEARNAELELQYKVDTQIVEGRVPELEARIEDLEAQLEAAYKTVNIANDRMVELERCKTELERQLKTAHRAVTDLIDKDIGNNYTGKIHALEARTKVLEEALREWVAARDELEAYVVSEDGKAKNASSAPYVRLLRTEAKARQALQAVTREEALRDEE